MKIQLTAKIYLLLFFLVSLIQSFFTELAHDEAYYWVYSQNIDWGHFDHPPAVSFLAAMGYAIFKNELGVRLFFVLANTVSLWLIWKIVSPKNYHLFFLLFFGCLIANVGFMAVPDTPLIFCVSAFLYVLKKYLEKDDWKIAILLGIIIAATGYSKYYGIIFFVGALFANLFLLKRKTFWLAIFIASVLFFPHLYWQYANDYPTFRFHLFDRSKEPYTFMFILEYIGGQLLVFGPFLGFLLFYAAYNFSPKDQFEKTLKWCFYFVFIFFLFQSFRGRVEPNWTAIGIAPLMYFGYHVMVGNEHLKKWATRLAIISIGLISITRLIIALDEVPIEGVTLPKEFHGWEAWAADLEEASKGETVVFFNSYQHAAKYHFYSGKKAHALNTSVYAGSEYDLLIKQQEDLQGTRVALVRGIPKEEKGILLGGMENVKITFIDDFQFYTRVKIKMLDPIKKMRPSESQKMKISIENPTDKTIVFKPNQGKKLELRCVVLEYKKPKVNTKALDEFPLEKLEPGEKKTFEATINAPEKAGNYRYRFMIHNGITDERNCNFQKLIVED